MRSSAVWFVTIAALIAAAGITSAAEQGITFVIREHGAPDRSVLISSIAHAPDADPKEVRAAQTLASRLVTMTGAQLPVEPQASPPPHSLLVGRLAVDRGAITSADLASLGWDGYCVRVGDDGIGMAGTHPRGTLYGAFGLLEDLGCRFFTPDCERVPHADQPVLTYRIKRDRPFFDLRTVEGPGGGSCYEFVGEPFAGLSDEERARYPRLWIDHTAGFLVPIWKYLDTHPEYFAHSPDGKVLFDIGTTKSELNPFGDDLVHDRTDMVWLCMSNPEVRRIATKTLLEWIARQPDVPFFSINQGDSDFACQCERCAAVGSVTNNLIAFANALAGPVAERFPGRTLLVFAYGNTVTPPTRARPAANVCVLFAPIDARSNIHSALSAEKNPVSRGQFYPWQRIAPGQMGVYEYNMGPQTPCLDKMISAITEYARNDMRGIFYCGSVSLMRELFLYVNAKLLWDPHQSPEALIHDFCAAYYGVGGPSMEAFVALKRKQVNAPNVSFGGFYGGRLGRAFYTPEFSAQAAHLLSSAERAVRDDPEALARVRRIRAAVLCGILGATDWLDPALSSADRAAYARSLSAYVTLMGRSADADPDVAEFLRTVARLRVSDPWGRDPLIARLRADPAATLEQEAPPLLASFAQESSDGWQVPLEAFCGGTGPVYYRWMCPGKMMRSTYGHGSGFDTATARFTLPEAPQGAYQLVLEGQSHAGPATTHIRIRLNGTILYEGPCGFVTRGWSTRSFPFPAGTLQAGENTLTIENLEPTGSNWFLFSEVKLQKTL